MTNSPITEKRSVSHWDEDIQHFMTHWFAGLMRGLEDVDEPARVTILRACGRACAQSYTAEVFADARKQSADMTAFLAALAERFPEATYELRNAHTIAVRYTHCACDLVRLELVKSPRLCACSTHNLQANFEHALGFPVTVTLEAAILRGDPHCAFQVIV